VQLRLLRLPESLAHRLRSEPWDIAAQPPNADPWLEVGPEEPGGEILLASFDGNSAGVRTAAEPRLDDEVLDSLGDLRGSAGTLPPEATGLAQICSAMLAVSSVNDDLWLCLESPRAGRGPPAAHGGTSESVLGLWFPARHADRSELSRKNGPMVRQEILSSS
jgi:hypothetical protein